MSRFYARIGVLIAGACGVFSAYTTFQPDLKRLQEQREGTFDAHHQIRNEHSLSDAIASDLHEARKKVIQSITGDHVSKTGPAWKLRQQLFGSRKEEAEEVVGGEVKPAPTAVQASPRHDSPPPTSVPEDTATPEECFRYLDSVCDKVLVQNKHVRELCDLMRRYVKRSREATERSWLEATVDDECLRIAKRLQAEGRYEVSQLVSAGIEGVLWYRDLTLGEPWTSQEETLMTIIAAQTTLLIRITGMQPTNLHEFCKTKAELFESQARVRAAAREEANATPSGTESAGGSVPANAGADERSSDGATEGENIVDPVASASANAHVPPTGRLKGKARADAKKAQAQPRR
ncbi:hypothetical protein Tdes44962_MAKER05641 [Teratosphaeria destructans]|uniref:Uncharacterized protein n=1 Tax=Teratosphaeria destructans TaxID=418781 RepID=A0A9W7VYA5_9PEZI|nr:hypothetical protein Tdes44962_MAKER05641 [Teratosphaeria destructans]